MLIPRRRVVAMTLVSVVSIAVTACSGDRVTTETPSATTTVVDTTEVDATVATTTDTSTDTMVPSDFAGYSFVGLEFFEVPVLGPADIRGSGCGSGVGEDAVLPDVLPDGIWMGSLGPRYESYDVVTSPEDGFGYSRFDGTTLEIDIWCVYAGATAEEKFRSAECQTDIECEANNSSGWLVEDQSDRLRSIPVAAGFVYREDRYDAELGWSCGTSDPWSVEATWRMQPVWIAVNAGEVTEIFGHCAYYLEASTPR